MAQPAGAWSPGSGSPTTIPATDGAWWAADDHVHLPRPDRPGTIDTLLDAAVDRGLARVTLVLQPDTGQVVDVRRSVDAARERLSTRRGDGLEVRAGVEVDVLDRSGRLDQPDRLEGADVVLIAEHRFPGPDGPLDPAVVGRWLRDGAVDARSVVELLIGGLIEAVGRSRRPAVLAQPLSLLPRLGLTEGQVPSEWLRALALRCRVTGSAVEVSERWACPGVAVVRLFHEEGVRLVAGSGADRPAGVGRWTSVRRTLSVVVGPAPARRPVTRG